MCRCAQVLASRAACEHVPAWLSWPARRWCWASSPPRRLLGRLALRHVALISACNMHAQVHLAFLAGLALVLALIPVNRWLALRIQAASVSMMAAKDRWVEVAGV